MHPLELGENFKIAAAILMGMIGGFLLVKANLHSRESIVNALSLKENSLFKTVLVMLILGITGAFFLRAAGGLTATVSGGYFYPSLIGGALAGLGLFLCGGTPITALAGAATGRIYFLWALIGMALAYPLVTYTRAFCSQAIASWGSELSTISPQSSYFNWSNPAFFLVALLIAMLIVVHLLLPDDGAKGE
ncbi:MAG: YeeE/YedE thiosulfate transporter family protein [Victivallaceae bacterium]|nr:YeeE/YedE thiosulfate transporter family protein [Victivallaceae bacterium]